MIRLVLKINAVMWIVIFIGLLVYYAPCTALGPDIQPTYVPLPSIPLGHHL